MRPEIQVSFYFLCRVMVLEIGLLVLDIASDFANGGKFILDGHAFVGGLTIAMVFLPGLVKTNTNRESSLTFSFRMTISLLVILIKVIYN